MRSSAIAMTPDELDGYLRSRDVAAFATVDGGGHPRAVAVRYTGGPGRLVALVPDTAASFADLDADSRVCVSVEEFPSYDAIRGVLVHGRARPEGRAADGFVAVAVVPDRIVSFDFGKIGARG